MLVRTPALDQISKIVRVRDAERGGYGVEWLEKKASEAEENASRTSGRAAEAFREAAKFYRRGNVTKASMYIREAEGLSGWGLSR